MWEYVLLFAVWVMALPTLLVFTAVLVVIGCLPFAAIAYFLGFWDEEPHDAD